MDFAPPSRELTFKKTLGKTNYSINISNFFPLRNLQKTLGIGLKKDSFIKVSFTEDTASTTPGQLKQTETEENITNVKSECKSKIIEDITRDDIDSTPFVEQFTNIKSEYKSKFVDDAGQLKPTETEENITNVKSECKSKIIDDITRVRTIQHLLMHEITSLRRKKMES
jgi:hypothetical protein